MDYIDNLQDSINFIEDNIRSDISLDDCAIKAAFSKFHYSRLFQMTTGYSPMEYIRKRRLSYAAMELFDNENPISNICYEFGFNSSENFTRAFTGMFGVTPSSYRKVKSSLNLLHKINLSENKALRYCDTLDLEPRFVNKPAFKFIGFQTYVDFSDTKNRMQAPKLWNRYHAQILHKSIPNKLQVSPRFDIGLGTDFFNGREGFNYSVGMEVTSFDNVPSDAVCIEIPRADYVVFYTPVSTPDTFVGNIHRTWGYIYKKWFPQSRYIHTGTHEFETYCEDLRTYSENIYIPIKRKG